jgi:hypothetical protein
MSSTVRIEFLGGPRDSEVLSNDDDGQAIKAQFLFLATAKGTVGRVVPAATRFGANSLNSGGTPQRHWYRVAETLRDVKGIRVRLKYVGAQVH